LEKAARSEYTKPPTTPSGGGGLVSTTVDYLRFAQMMLNGGELDGVRLLGRKTVGLMTINHLPDRTLPFSLPNWPHPGYGFGLGFSVVMNLAQTQVLESVGNFSWGGAASTRFWVDPKEELIGLLMTQFRRDNYYPLTPEFKILTYQALVD